MELERFVTGYAKWVTYRLGGPCLDQGELRRDLAQEGRLAILRIKGEYDFRIAKRAVRFAIMKALTQWRWQVTYHGKNYVPRDEVFHMVDGDCDTAFDEQYNPEAWAIAREEAVIKMATRLECGHKRQPDRSFCSICRRPPKIKRAPLSCVPAKPTLTVSEGL